jgi:7-keto-8-aminopelargonate synthetase-like enzyme
VGCFKAALSEIGLTNLGPSQIVPIMIGDSSRALHIAQSLRDQGIFATAVRPPTVPEGTARLRFSITRHLGHEALQKAAALIGAALAAS